MNLRELKEVFRLVEKTDFTEVEIVHGDTRVRIGRGKGTSAITHPVLAPTYIESAPSIAPAPPVTSEVAERALGKASTPKTDTQGLFVTSPFVGTFYRTPSPDSAPYVEVGTVVKKGQPLCIIEAMKLMNEIESDFDGKVAEIYAQNGQAVEFGAKLIRIEPL